MNIDALRKELFMAPMKSNFTFSRDELIALIGFSNGLQVWYGSLPESNGKTNWTAILHRGDITKGITIDMSEYPDRTRYEADRMRWMIGELDKEPWVLDYDADKHSGYVSPATHRSDADTSVEISDDHAHALYKLAHQTGFFGWLNEFRKSLAAGASNERADAEPASDTEEADALRAFDKTKRDGHSYDLESYCAGHIDKSAERADAEKDAALTDDEITALVLKYFSHKNEQDALLFERGKDSIYITLPSTNTKNFVRAILAAKEN